jgi:hypothetical protein
MALAWWIYRAPSGFTIKVYWQANNRMTKPRMKTRMNSLDIETLLSTSPRVSGNDNRIF